MTTVLIVEDEQSIRELLRDNLEFEGMATREAATLAAADAAIDTHPDLVILDVNLPDGDGVHRLTDWRRRGIRVPIVVCTIKDREIDVVRALEAGADDYVTKPFRIRELLARLRAVLRRGRAAAPPLARIGGCDVDFAARVVRRSGSDIHLTLTEWTLLEYLWRNRNLVISREQIVQHIWAVDELEDSRAVDVHIGRLRRKLQATGDPDPIVTVRGLGYRLTQ